MLGDDDLALPFPISADMTTIVHSSKLLQGGIETRVTTEVYGIFASGKSFQSSICCKYLIIERLSVLK